MTEQVAIVHPEWGIFVGVMFGLAFWSALDCAGQDQAAVMTEDEARKFVDMFNPNIDRSAFTYHPVRIAGDHWATIEELETAGLSQWTTSLKAARMGPAAGGLQ